VGDQYAQEELDAENAEAERYPLGPKEFWRARMVVNYLYGPDRHPMTIMMEQHVNHWRQVYASLAAGVAYLGGPEIVGPNMEFVALFEPYYAGEPDEPTPGHSFIVRHVNGEWLIAANARRLPVPGWPPSEETIPGLRADGN
jgi:hypothetical protein